MHAERTPHRSVLFAVVADVVAVVDDLVIDVIVVVDVVVIVAVVVVVVVLQERENRSRGGGRGRGGGGDGGVKRKEGKWINNGN